MIHIQSFELYNKNINENKTNNEQLPAKLYVENHLSNTAKYLSRNTAYIHYLGVSDNNSILAYNKPFKEEITYEFDVQKMLSLGFTITHSTYIDENTWEIIIPDEFIKDKENSLIKDINKYMTKVIINIESFDLVSDIKDEADFISKYGKSSVPLDIIYKKY